MGDKLSLKGRLQVTWPIYFLWAPIISLERLKQELSNFMYR